MVTQDFDITFYPFPSKVADFAFFHIILLTRKEAKMAIPFKGGNCGGLLLNSKASLLKFKS